jgi:ABC-type glycerol-3-phosphate transport system substrate-binding protein/regulation of enolase protein 1 (concanavalin A-like superfamily)
MGSTGTATLGLRQRLSRRSVLAAGAAATAGALLPAAGAAASRQASPIHLVVSIGYQGGGNFAGVYHEVVQRYIDEHWTAQHPGVRVSTIAGDGSNGNGTEGVRPEIAASLAGTPADVITGFSMAWPEYLAAGMLRNLDPFIAKDNLDLGVFSPGHLAALTTPQGHMALPEYDGPEVMLINLGTLDDLGLKYPEDDWTSAEAEALWRQVAGEHNGKWLYGASVDFPHGGWEVAGWGGTIGTADGLRCNMDSAACTAAYTWWMGLLQDNVLFGNNSTPAHNSGGYAMMMMGGWTIEGALAFTRSGKWRYFPMPSFPQRRATFTNDDFYAINEYSQNPPDLVWDIFKFVVLDPGFQRLQWGTTLVTPNQIDMWPDWIAYVSQIAPPLRTMNLAAYAQAMEYGVAQYFWQYENIQAYQLRDTNLMAIQAQQVSVPLGLHRATAAINALEAAVATGQAAAARNTSQAATAVAQAAAGKLTVFPAPHERGLGSPPTAAGSLVAAGNGSYRLTALGRTGNTLTAGTFVCAPTTAVQASWSCRLVSLTDLDANPQGSDFTGGFNHVAKAGLMVRQDLSDAAPNVLLNVNYDDGVCKAVQRFAEVNWERTSLGNASTWLLAPKAPSASSNLLKAPLWLRLVRQNDAFTALWSQDGSTWQALGRPSVVLMAGAWVGLFVSSGSKAGHRVQAVFDHVSGFAPGDYLVLGA